MSGKTPGEAARDHQAEQDEQAFYAWAEYWGYDSQQGFEFSDMQHAFTCGMQAERDPQQSRELLKRAADALWACAKAALTVKPTLDQPYPDDPRWTPYTRWVERPAREAHDLAMAIRKHLKDGQP